MKNSRTLPLFACLLGSSIVHAGIVGKDGRRNFSDKKDPKYFQTQIGWFGIDGEEGGSSLVTGENCDVVITAAHNLYYPWARLKSDHTIFFGPTHRNGGYIAEIVEHEYTIGKTSASHKQHDWLVARLYKPLMDKCVQFKFDTPAKCKGNLQVVGQPIDWDTNEGNAISEESSHFSDQKCKQVRYSGKAKTFKMDCDIKGGNSGGPIFCEENGKKRVVGIVWGTTHHISYKEPIRRGHSGPELSYATSAPHYNNGVTFHENFKVAIEKELEKSKTRKAERIK